MNEFIECLVLCIVNKQHDATAHRKKSHFINALCNHTNTVTLSDTSHTILKTEQSNLYSDDNNFFGKDRLKQKGILLHIIDVVNDNLGSELDGDT